MSDRNAAADDHEVAHIVTNRDAAGGGKRPEDIRKARPRSPSQSPVTVQKSESILPTAEDREKWKSSGPRWIKNIEEGFFKKIEQQFEASVNGYGADNGIELDLSGSADDEHHNGAGPAVGESPADRAAVAAEYWQEVSAKANLTNSRSAAPVVVATAAPSDHHLQPHEHQLLARPGVFGSDRSPLSSPAITRPVDNHMSQQPQILSRDSLNQQPSQRFSPRPDLSPGYMNNALGGDSRQARSPGILQLNRGPVLRPSGPGGGAGGGRVGVIQTGYMRNARFEDGGGRRDYDQGGDGGYRDNRDNHNQNNNNNNNGNNFRDSRNRNNSESNSLRNRTQGGINLGPYEELFRNPLPGGVKFIDSHAHWCFTIKKLQSQGIETYRDMRNSFPEMFPPSFGGSIQVFCLPLYLKSYDHWYRKLIEGTENELWFTYGCHPNFVDDWNDDVKQGMSYSMRTANELDRLVGLGEIGLDYNRQNNNEEKKRRQRDVFKVQLEMAVRHNLPIVIHCRNDEGHGGNNQAELDCFDIMTQHVPHDWKIHRHCFRGSFSEANKWMDHFPKVAFGFTPCIGGNKDLMARDAVKQLPLEKILLETDAPYYTPAAMSNFPMESAGDKQPRKVAIPGGIALVTAHEISKLKDIPLEVVVERTRENTLKLYGIVI